MSPQRVRVQGDLYHGRIPDGAVYVGRPAPGLAGSPYANPHKGGHCRRCNTTHDRAGSITAYAHYLDNNPALVKAARRDLAGNDLACWCKPPDACHVDILMPVVAGQSPLAALNVLLGVTAGGVR